MSETHPLAAGSTDYLVRPASGKGRGILVMHPWWGLNAVIRSVCDRLAAEGFVVLAPDLYHGRIATTIAEAEALQPIVEGTEESQEIAKQEITRAAQLLSSVSSKPDIGVVGFSMGVYWSLWLLRQPGSQVAAAVEFYGTGGGDYSKSRAAFQFHFAENDPYESAESTKEQRSILAAAGKQAEFYTYPGTSHWFFESDRADAYNAAAASLAWQRTIAFLKAHLP